MTKPEPKPTVWWKSKTLRLAAATTVVSVLGLVAGEEWIQAYPEAVSGLGLGAGVLMAVIRYYTVSPLKGR
jgi:hypothetical protein